MKESAKKHTFVTRRHRQQCGGSQRESGVEEGKGGGDGDGKRLLGAVGAECSVQMMIY